MINDLVSIETRLKFVTCHLVLLYRFHISTVSTCLYTYRSNFCQTSTQNLLLHLEPGIKLFVNNCFISLSSFFTGWEITSHGGVAEVGGGGCWHETTTRLPDCQLGRKHWETSLWTVPTPMLHGLTSRWRTSQSKGSSLYFLIISLSSALLTRRNYVTGEEITLPHLFSYSIFLILIVPSFFGLSNRSSPISRFTFSLFIYYSLSFLSVSLLAGEMSLFIFPISWNRVLTFPCRRPVNFKIIASIMNLC